MKTTLPAIEDRIWAALTHFSALVMGMGLILPIIAWSEKRRTSKYVTFQALQALGYQSLWYTVWVLVALVVAVVSLLSMLANLETFVNNAETEVIRWVFTHMGITFALLGLYFILPVIAGVACLFGREFHYPFMGKRLARYVGYDAEAEWLNEEHEDRWVIAMSHFTVIIIPWGLLAPLGVWFMQASRNSFLKFQSLQTAVFQGIAFVLSVFAMILYMAGIFTLFIGLSSISSTANGDPFPIGLMIIVFAILLIAVLILLFIPFLHIVGQWAGYQVLKGDEYRYPVVGKLAEKRLGRTGN